MWLIPKPDRARTTEDGLGLVEVLVALAITATAVVAFIVALSAGTLAVSEQDEEVVAQSLAQTQMEYTKAYPFSPGGGAYPTIQAPDGYTITATASGVPFGDADIQKITVTVRHDGAVVLVLEDYKVNR